MNLQKVIKGSVGTAVRTVLPLLLTAFISFVAVFSQYLRVFFYILERPWSELLDYQQDYLEKGVKVEPDLPECSQYVWKRIFCLLQNILNPPKADMLPRHFDEQLDTSNTLCDCSSCEIENESVYDILKESFVSQDREMENIIQQEKETEIDADPVLEEIDAGPADLKSKKSRRKNRKRGRKGHPSSIEATSSKPPKQVWFSKEDSTRDSSLNRTSRDELIPPPTPTPQQLTPRHYKEIENCRIQNNKSTQVSKKSSSKPTWHNKQQYEKCETNKVEIKQVVMQPNLFKEVDDFNMVGMVDTWEMEELLAHIEIIRFKSRVDGGAIEWYEKNLNLLASIDVRSLVRKLHGHE